MLLDPVCCKKRPEIKRRNVDQKYKFINENDMVSVWRNLKNTFSGPLSTIIPEILKFRPYSILTRKPMVGCLICYVLMLIRIFTIASYSLLCVGQRFFQIDSAESCNFCVTTTEHCSPLFYSIPLAYFAPFVGTHKYHF